MAEFLPVDPAIDAAWDDFVRASPDGWVFGLAGWQRLIERVERWDLRPLSFEMRDNGRRVAIVPLHLTSAGVVASSGWGLVGPMLAADLPVGRRRGVLKRVMARVEEVAVGLCATAVMVGAPAVTRSALASRRGVNPFVRLGYEDISGNAMVVDLSADEAVLWSGLSANARQEIRKAERLGWQAAEAAWAEHLDDYYAVHVETYRRTGVEPHPRAYFAGIAAETAPAGHARLWVGRDPEGRPQAYHNDAVLGPGVLYHTGCSTAAALDAGINYLLMWRAILCAKARGATHYEIGEVFFDVRAGKQEGLTRFKTKFGGELHRAFRARKVLAPAEATDASRPQPTSAAAAATANSSAVAGTLLDRLLRRIGAR